MADQDIADPDSSGRGAASRDSSGVVPGSHDPSDRLVDSIPFPVSHWASVRDDDGEIVEFICVAANSVAEQLASPRLNGRTTLEGARYREVFAGTEGDFGWQRFTEVVRTGTTDVFEATSPGRPDLWFEHVTARHGDGFLNITRDITQRRRAESALEEVEERFRSTMEALTNTVMILDPIWTSDAADADSGESTADVIDLRFRYCNEAATQMLGKSLDELVGHRYLDVYPERHTEAFDRYLDVVRTGVAAHFEVSWVDVGPLRGAFEVHAFPLGEGLVVVSHDITERVIAQHEARESERQFRLMADHAGDVVIAARHGVIEWAAPSVERLMGWTVEQVVGRATLDFVHPDDAERLDVAKWNTTSTTRHRCRLLRSDGGWRWADLLGRIAGPDDEPDHPLVITVIDAQAEVEARDALQRAEEERHRLDEQVRESARLESLSQLAGGIAHDFNNLLVGVLGNAEMALQDLPPDSPVRSRLTALSTAAQRAAELTRQLLDFTGRQPRQRLPLDLALLIFDSVDLARSMMAREVAVTVHLGSGTPAVTGDRGQLQQVVMNLLMNASEAVDQRSGQIEVSTRFRHLADDAAAELGLDGGTYVTLGISDNGIGIAAEHQPRIFDPFFTTRSGGRGLGLSVVSGIVRSHLGAVQVTSDPGHGSTFEVWLPAADAHLAPLAPPTNFRLHRQPTVLVVDDDDQVRDVVGDILRRAGFQVLAVARGREAISLFAVRHATIDTVVLDLTMPDVSGAEVMVVLRAVEPSIPIVLISGYLSNDPTREATTMKAAGFVQKPFLPEELVDAVRRSLHQTPFGSRSNDVTAGLTVSSHPPTEPPQG